jgi:hypothetical protein
MIKIKYNPKNIIINDQTKIKKEVIKNISLINNYLGSSSESISLSYDPLLKSYLILWDDPIDSNYKAFKDLYLVNAYLKQALKDFK